MFHKDDDALRRMEEALLAEEEPAQEEEELFEIDDEEELVVRNFANHYRAYSNHRTDVDLEEYSREVYEPRKRRSNLPLLCLALVLTALILAVVAYLIRRMGVL